MTEDMHPRARACAEAICKRVEGGTPIAHACALEGVPKRTWYALLERDEDVADMQAAARAVGAEAARKELREVALTGEGNANVLLHLLERAHPDEYAPPPKRLETTGADGGPQRVEHSGAVTVSVSENDAAIARLAAKAGT